MKTSEVFAHALEFLWDGRKSNNDKETFICFCLSKAHQHYFFDLKKHLDIIHSWLEGHECLEDWIMQKHDIWLNYMESDTIKMQETRKQWLEHLIKHYESIGD